MWKAFKWEKVNMHVWLYPIKAFILQRLVCTAACHYTAIYLFIYFDNRYYLLRPLARYQHAEPLRHEASYRTSQLFFQFCYLIFFMHLPSLALLDWPLMFYHRTLTQSQLKPEHKISIKCCSHMDTTGSYCILACQLQILSR